MKFVKVIFVNCTEVINMGSIIGNDKSGKRSPLNSAREIIADKIVAADDRAMLPINIVSANKV